MHTSNVGRRALLHLQRRDALGAASLAGAMRERACFPSEGTLEGMDDLDVREYVPAARRVPSLPVHQFGPRLPCAGL